MEIRNWQRGYCSPGSPPAQAPPESCPPPAPWHSRPHLPPPWPYRQGLPGTQQSLGHLLWVWESSTCLCPPGGAGRHDRERPFIWSTSGMPRPWPGWGHGTGSCCASCTHCRQMLQHMPGPNVACEWLSAHVGLPTVLQDPWNGPWGADTRGHRVAPTTPSPSGPSRVPTHLPWCSP